MERHHTYKVPPGDTRYEIYKDGTLIETSEPQASHELAVGNGNERACELDGIWD